MKKKDSENWRSKKKRPRLNAKESPRKSVRKSWKDSKKKLQPLLPLRQPSWKSKKRKESRRKRRKRRDWRSRSKRKRRNCLQPRRSRKSPRIKLLKRRSNSRIPSWWIHWWRVDSQARAQWWWECSPFTLTRTLTRPSSSSRSSITTSRPLSTTSSPSTTSNATLRSPCISKCWAQIVDQPHLLPKVRISFHQSQQKFQWWILWWAWCLEAYLTCHRIWVLQVLDRTHSSSCNSNNSCQWWFSLEPCLDKVSLHRISRAKRMKSEFTTSVRKCCRTTTIENWIWFQVI